MKMGRPRLPAWKKKSIQPGLRFTVKEWKDIVRQIKTDGMGNFSAWGRFVIRDYVRSMQPRKGTFEKLVIGKPVKGKIPMESIAWGCERVRFIACPCKANQSTKR